MQKLQSIARFRTNLIFRVIASMITVTILLIEGLKENTKEIDSLHHGLIFPAAIAVREGLFPNLDAFAQYGPLNPFLQGSWLKIAGNRVFDLQTFTLLITILIGILLFDSSCLVCNWSSRPSMGFASSQLIDTHSNNFNYC